MGLALAEYGPDGEATGVATHMDLGADPTARTAERLLLLVGLFARGASLSSAAMWAELYPAGVTTALAQLEESAQRLALISTGTSDIIQQGSGHGTDASADHNLAGSQISACLYR
jgi:hypothetical protein